MMHPDLTCFEIDALQIRLDWRRDADPVKRTCCWQNKWKWPQRFEGNAYNFMIVFLSPNIYVLKFDYEG